MSWLGFGQAEWVCAAMGTEVADLSFGDALSVQTSCLCQMGSALCPSSAAASTVREAHELRKPDLRYKRMVAEVVLYKIPVCGANFTKSSVT